MKFLLPIVVVLAMPPVLAQTPPEAQHTVQTKFVEPSAKTMLKPGDKIENLFQRNLKQTYVLQRLTERSY